MPYKDPEKERERRRKYNEANKEKIRETRRKYSEANREKLLESGRKYRESNRDRNIKYREANPDKIWKKSLEKYGITPEDYRSLLESQGWVCVICGTFDDLRRAPQVDHCHSPLDAGECKRDKVRGVLCNLCNLGLGSFRDSPALLQKAIDYLADPPAQRILKKEEVCDQAIRVSL